MGQVKLGQVSYLVLDEADRMLDMGFEPQIQRIVARLPQQRQTLFFSATWPKEVKSIASQFVRNHPVRVFVGGVDEKLVANKAITQMVMVVNQHEKMSQLTALLRSKPRGTKAIIFAGTKRMCDQLSYTVGREFNAIAIHGDKRQQERDAALASFKAGRNPVLVATDVAARGLDVKDVEMVINYDFPNGVEDYIHRIGRTGRAGATGEAYTLFTSNDSKYARELSQVLSEAGQQVPTALAEMSRYGGGGGRSSRWGGGGGGGRGGRGGAAMAAAVTVVVATVVAGTASLVPTWHPWAQAQGLPTMAAQQQQLVAAMVQQQQAAATTAGHGTRTAAGGAAGAGPLCVAAEVAAAAAQHMAVTPLPSVEWWHGIGWKLCWVWV
jgi:ATP-dependent RNA helicase DDX5/DBP2